MDPEAMFGMAIGFGMFVVVPIVFGLLSHQRSMAKLIREQRTSTNDSLDRRMEALERRIEEIGYRVNDAILRSEDRQSAPIRETPPPVDTIHERLHH